MKKVFAFIVLIMLVSSCYKPKDAIVVTTVQQPTGTFVFYNETKHTYRIELWRFNSGGAIPVFYTILSGQSMVVSNSIAGKWVIGVLQMSGYPSQEERVDYGLTMVLEANCFFAWYLK